MRLKVTLVKKQQARYLMRNQKFGLEHLKTVEEALAHRYQEWLFLWAYAITKEMEVAFKILPDRDNNLVGFQFVWFYIVFEIKMEKHG